MNTGRLVADNALASFQVQADVRAPRTIVENVEGAIASTSPTITGRVLDNLSGVAEFSYKIDGGSFAPLTFNSVGQFSLATNLATNGTADGAHRVTFRAVDAAGNWSDEVYSFTLDSRTPTVSITSPSAGAALEAGARLVGSASGTGSSLVALSFSIDSGAAQPLPFTADGSFSTLLDLAPLSLGDHTVHVTARDAAGLTTTSNVTFHLGAAVPLTLAGVWPTDESIDLGVTVRPRVDFSRAVKPETLNSNSLFVTDPAGNRMLAGIVPSSDGTFAWLFLRDAMPGGARMTITVDGSLIQATDGQLLDADGNGSPGGVFTSEFTTVSRTLLENTSLVGVLA
ncbi:MAG TPA: hypothetical protein PLV92_29495, partial [Pirellulaceae bacterium]|nr:hypothetical protein [Pirellulaceae bacterium]